MNQSFMPSIRVRFFLLTNLMLFLTACSLAPHKWSHANHALGHQVRDSLLENLFSTPSSPRSGIDRASSTITWDRTLACRQSKSASDQAEQNNGACQDDDTFVALALSGGGSRAAILSAAIMFELEKMNINGKEHDIMQQVDLISSVSGGSIAAAYYALSCDPNGEGAPEMAATSCPEATSAIRGKTRPVWEKEQVIKALQTNFISDWLWSWFYPNNFLRYWFTGFDRSDIMAETYSDTLFDQSLTGTDNFLFMDLNPLRPNLIINATNVTEEEDNVPTDGDSRIFPFTRQQFKKLGSDLGSYPIAHAVMASSAFPGVFQDVTLKNFKKTKLMEEKAKSNTNNNKPFKKDRYVHLIDGGPSDNLGLITINNSLTEILKHKKPKRVVVILVDAFTPLSGDDPTNPNPRGKLDYFIDTNALTATDIMLYANRKLALSRAEEERRKLENDRHINAHFIHMNLNILYENGTNEELSGLNDDVLKAFNKAGKIKTSLAISPDQVDALKTVAHYLVNTYNKEKLKAAFE